MQEENGSPKISNWIRINRLISAAAETGSTETSVLFPLLRTPQLKNLRGFFMEEYVVYILASNRTPKLYKGFTTNLIERFKSHNQLSTKGWTVRFRPWRVVFVQFFLNKKEAMDFEKFLKTGAGREWIAKNIKLDKNQ